MLKRIIIVSIVIFATAGIVFAQIDSLEEKVYLVNKKELASVVAEIVKARKERSSKLEFEESYLRKLALQKKLMEYDMMKYRPMDNGMLQGQINAMSMQLQQLMQMLVKSGFRGRNMAYTPQNPAQSLVVVQPNSIAPQPAQIVRDNGKDEELLKNQAEVSKQLAEAQASLRNLDSLYKSAKDKEVEVKSDTALMNQMKGLLAQNKEMQARLLALQNVKPKSEAPKYTGESEKIFFANGSKKLSTQSLDIIAKVVTKLSENPSYQIMIKGFASKKGNSLFNQRLSATRTDAVKEALMRLGVSPAKVLSSYYGEDLQAVEDAYARRVEILYIDNGF